MNMAVNMIATIVLKLLKARALHKLQICRALT